MLPCDSFSGPGTPDCTTCTNQNESRARHAAAKPASRAAAPERENEDNPLSQDLHNPVEGRPGGTGLKRAPQARSRGTSSGAKKPRLNGHRGDVHEQNTTNAYAAAYDDAAAPDMQLDDDLPVGPSPADLPGSQLLPRLSTVYDNYVDLFTGYLDIQHVDPANSDSDGDAPDSSMQGAGAGGGTAHGAPGPATGAAMEPQCMAHAPTHAHVAAGAGGRSPVGGNGAVGRDQVVAGQYDLLSSSDIESGSASDDSVELSSDDDGDDDDFDALHRKLSGAGACFNLLLFCLRRVAVRSFSTLLTSRSAVECSTGHEPRVLARV